MHQPSVCVLHHVAAPPDSESDSSAPNTGDSTTAVSEISSDIAEAICAAEAQQDAEDVAAAAAEEPPAPRAQRRIDFTAATARNDGQCKRTRGQKVASGGTV